MSKDGVRKLLEWSKEKVRKLWEEPIQLFNNCNLQL